MLPMQIDVESASRLLTEDESVLLLDVRELAEYETVHLPNSLLIPTSEFMEKVEQLKGKENQRILVICHHGVRSQGAATWMRANGFEQATKCGMRLKNEVFDKVYVSDLMRTRDTWRMVTAMQSYRYTEKNKRLEFSP